MRKMKVIRERRGKKILYFLSVKDGVSDTDVQIAYQSLWVAFSPLHILFTFSVPFFSSLVSYLVSSYHCSFSSLLFTFVSLSSPLPLPVPPSPFSLFTLTTSSPSHSSSSLQTHPGSVCACVCLHTQLLAVCLEVCDNGDGLVCI